MANYLTLVQFILNELVINLLTALRLVEDISVDTLPCLSDTLLAENIPTAPLFSLAS
jgi:hypothetical protein